MPNLTENEYHAARNAFGLYGTAASEDAAIRYWQRRLLELGHDLGDSGPNRDGVDGIPGRQTYRALDRHRPRPNNAPPGARPRWQMNTAAFFNAIRSSLFGGQLTADQVRGIERLLGAWRQYGTGDARHLAYVLATSYWETGRKMNPVPEVGRGRGRRYGRPAGPYGHVYYGRGDVQLTWLENYEKMSRLLGLDLVQFPDHALRPDVSARILIEGMTRGASRSGDFTGKAVEDYIVGSRCDYEGARRVVNGMDRSRQIAGFARLFEAALSSAGLPMFTEVGT